MRTIYFNSSYIKEKYSMLGKLEHNPSISKNVDYVIDKYDIDKKSYEESEAEFQTVAFNGLLNKSKIKLEDVNLIIGTDLQNQILASNINASKFDIPFLGIYSACAGFAEGLILASQFLSKEYKNIVLTVSSHNLVNEKQFRFPIEYGSPKKKINSFSSTGAVSTLITNEKTNIKIESCTIGNVVDMGHKDTNDMGAAMAPSAAEVLYNHLKDTKRKPSYYNLILTGDLGIYGLYYLKEYLYEKYNLEVKNISDAGSLLFNTNSSSSFTGGSGPICLPLILFNKIIKNKKYKKILIIGTGALHSSTSSNLKLSMLSVSHALSLEVL